MVIFRPYPEPVFEGLPLFHAVTVKDSDIKYRITLILIKLDQKL